MPVVRSSIVGVDRLIGVIESDIGLPVDALLLYALLDELSLARRSIFVELAAVLKVVGDDPLAAGIKKLTLRIVLRTSCPSISFR